MYMYKINGYAKLKNGANLDVKVKIWKCLEIDKITYIN